MFEHVKAAERNDTMHSAIAEHLCSTGHTVRLENTNVIYHEKDNFARLVKETIAINHFRLKLVPQNFSSVAISPNWFDTLMVHNLPITKIHDVPAVIDM